MMTTEALKSFLDEKVLLYNNKNFIDSDPVQIPHLYTQKEDIEIAGFLAATISWGNRKMIVSNSHKLMQIMGNSPCDFVMNHKENHLEKLSNFVHRTFNATDAVTFIKALQNIYKNNPDLENVFAKHIENNSTQKSISEFKKTFFEISHLPRTQKHISDPLNGSAAKRINMFLRWMVRNDTNGVDLGIWKTIPTAALSCPLDVHSGNVARKLLLLTRKQNDAKALNELDTNLRKLDANDPVKYDFALFGLGVFEGF
jgi:uncharacterized protein (TIGR02757 family)